MEKKANLSPEIKAQWLAALRSWKYEQGESCLRSRDDRFCCLGVLADILFPENWSKDDSDYYLSGFPGSVYWAYLPENILDTDIQGVLTLMNDGGDTFNMIADWIERNL